MGGGKCSLENLVNVMEGWGGKKKLFHALMLYIMVIILIFGKVIFGNKSLYPLTYTGRSANFLISHEDFDSYIHAGGVFMDAAASDWVEIPIMTAALKNIQNGELPLWSRYNALGMPIIDNNNGSSLAPFSLIVYLNNSERGWSMMYILRLLFLMLFTYLFLSELGIKYISSVMGGIVFGLSGYVMVYLNIFFMHVDAFLPILMWITLRYRKKACIGRWIGCSVIVALMCVGGNPQNLITCSVLAFTFYIFSVFQNYDGKISKKIKAIVLYCSSYIMGILLTLGYWLSFCTLYLNCYSYHGNAGLATMSIEHLLGFIFPIAYLGRLRALWLPYAGVVVLSVILFQLEWKKNKRHFKEQMFFGAFTILFLLKIAGFPLLQWVGKLPVLSELSFVKYNSGIYFSIAVLFAIALDDMQTRESIWRKKIQCIFFIVMAFVINIVNQNGMFTEEILLNDYIESISVILILIAIVSLYGMWIKKSMFLFVLICIVTCIELISYPLHVGKLFLNEGMAFTEPDFVDALRAEQENDFDRIMCVDGLLMGNLSSIYGFHNVGGISATQELHYWNFMNEFVLYGDLDLQFATTQSSIYHPESKRYLDMLGVKFIMIDDFRKIEDESLIPVYDDGRLTIYRNAEAFERLYTIHDVVWSDCEEKSFEIMRDSNFDFRKSAVVEREEPLEHIQEATTEGDFIKSVDYKANTISAVCDMKSNGILVLSDLYYPGWKVYVNGEKRELLRTNDILRGVYLDKGENIVEFVYRPSALIIGTTVSVICLIMLVCILLIYQYKRKSEKGAKE